MCGWNVRVPWNSAVYATARPKGVARGKADIMLSLSDSAFWYGSRKWVATTPAVKFCPGMCIQMSVQPVLGTPTHLMRELHCKQVLNAEHERQDT